MKVHIVEYQQEDGRIPFQEWFNELDVQAAAKVTTGLLRLSLGHTSNLKWFEGMGEYKINWGPGYRIYLAKEGDALIILLGGGTKGTQQKDIQRAKKALKEYQTRKKMSGKKRK
jgi:putative addiction module killer protein